jgi:hypothetical protein
MGDVVNRNGFPACTILLASIAPSLCKRGSIGIGGDDEECAAVYGSRGDEGSDDVEEKMTSSGLTLSKRERTCLTGEEDPRTGTSALLAEVDEFRLGAKASTLILVRSRGHSPVLEKADFIVG